MVKQINYLAQAHRPKSNFVYSNLAGYSDVTEEWGAGNYSACKNNNPHGFPNKYSHFGIFEKHERLR